MRQRPWLVGFFLLGGLAGLPAPARASQYGNSPVAVSLAAEGTQAQLLVRRCIEAAARVHRLPPAVLLILLQVEDGRLGRVSDNTNATVDIGPMQVNEIWLPKVAAHWGASVPERLCCMDQKVGMKHLPIPTVTPGGRIPGVRVRASGSGC